ncbi:helix-turn-helix domain-containing protein [Lacticaseibacillus pantheris]|uniref:helix-turn-helix domain-containing protein n=1 Tax=Lacticaseibacillus pantheris TaxID=171523 RepID=UPI00265A6EF5|nr:helix-turn-helix transcriptional regulator [Lacticaseibacillus pantheris]WKF85996.1 helix-turn-helix transcriptional regulator [Lacticaseibacillus pantheris]
MDAVKEKLTLRQWRQLKGLRVSDLATMSGLTERTVNSYEHSIDALRAASYKNIESLAFALGISTGDIFLSPTSEKPKYEKAR